jgi:hypothetical protein
MVAVKSTGSEIMKIRCVVDYNGNMRGINPIDCKRRRGLKQYIKFFKRNLNVMVHNAYMYIITNIL